MTVRVKICGIRTPDIMRAALDAGADDVGLVFFAKSPRNVALAEAKALADITRGRARIVALTVDGSDAVLDEIAGVVRPDLMQLHGREPPERCVAIALRWNVPVMKAVGVATAADLQRALAYAPLVERVLLDAKPPPGATLPGGNGMAFDWRLIANANLRVPFMLSGGLTPANVAAAIAATGATAVDVSSGVETSPGVKDAGLIRAFISAAKAARI